MKTQAPKMTSPSEPLLHWCPTKVLGVTPPSCTNWNDDERVQLVNKWEAVTCPECLRDRKELEAMWGFL